MRLEQYLKIVGTITRADAAIRFGMSKGEIRRMIRKGMLLVERDAITPFADKLSLAHPESVWVDNFSGLKVFYEGKAQTVSFDPVSMLWRVEDKLLNTTQIKRIIASSYNT